MKENLNYSRSTNRRLFELLKYFLDSQGKRFLKTKNKSLFKKNVREIVINKKILALKQEIIKRNLKFKKPVGVYKAACTYKNVRNSKKWKEV